MTSEFLTVSDMAERLKVKESWVYAHADDLGAYHLGKYLRFSWDRVLQSLEGYQIPLVSQPSDLTHTPMKRAPERHREPIRNRFLRKIS